MQRGRGGMGSHKHGVSGHAGKSPRLRHQLKLEAEKKSIPDRSKLREVYQSVKDAIENARRLKP